MAGNPPDYDNIRFGGGVAAGGLRMPMENGPATIMLKKEVDINVGGAGVTNTINLQPNQTIGSYYTLTNAGSGATTVVWPGVFPGLVFTAYNNSGQSATFKVTGKTGIVVANTKKAILVMDSVAGDILRVTADT